MIENKIINQPINMLDIGANIGYISMGLIKSNLVKKSLAIEPELYNFSLLKKNVEQNSYTDKIMCINSALGEKPLTTETMELNERNYGDHRIKRKNPLISDQEGEPARKTVSVESTTLSEILSRPDIKNWIDPVNLIWIDVQGSEGHIFKTEKDFFSKTITVAEIWSYGILRSGMSLKEFNEIVVSIWKTFCIIDGTGLDGTDFDTKNYKKYAIEEFNKFLSILLQKGTFKDVIFTCT
jgi:FkbM family methyltransferase